MRFDFDLIAVGGGAAGLVASGMAALLGAKAALIEEHKLGGDCTWTGCVPSKTLLRAAKAAHEARNSGQFGIECGETRVNFPRVMEHVRKVREHVYRDSDSPERFEKLGVRVIEERARFTDAHTVELSSGRRLTSKYFVIATGARPREPRFRAPVLTSENLFELAELPARLAVIGAGPVGIEMAQAFRRLGSEVTVIAPGEHVLQRDDAELADIVQRRLESDGVAFRLGRRAVDWDGVRVQLDDGSAVECDQVLAAVGREPRVEELGLDAAGVRFSERGVETDDGCVTSRRHIFASGDVTGRSQFTHMAEHMSKVAVWNALLKWPRKIEDRHAVWCTYSEPELAWLGASETALRALGVAHEVFRFPYERLDRAVTDSAGEGLVKVVADRSGRVLGAGIAGAQAGEMIGEWAVAMKAGLKMKDVSAAIHPYPTYAMGNRQAADLWTRKMAGGWELRLIGKLMGWRGRG